MPSFQEELQKAIQTQHQNLLKRFLDTKPGTLKYYQLDAQLDYVERKMLDEPPKGKRKGLLPPEMSQAPPPKTIRLKDIGIEPYTWEEIDDILADQDFTPIDAFVWDVLDQNGKGSCAAEGDSGCAMAIREFQQLPRVKLNPWGLYWFSGHGRDAGSSLQDNLYYSQLHGIPSQAVWPRSKGLRKPSDEAMEDAKKYRLHPDGIIKLEDPREYATALLLPGFPVYSGYPGHAWFASKLLSRDRFLWVNSWDESWGDNGRGTLRFSGVQWSYGVYVPYLWTWSLAA